MTNPAELLSYLHDGTLVEIEGELPSIRARVEIGYLARRLPGSGESLWLELVGCSRFEFTKYEDTAAITDLQRIAALEIEILDASETAEGARLGCAEGTLDLVCERLALKSETKETISLEMLAATANAYWDSL